ncbi:hypothetical protein DEU56DRAFT_759888 [Suillus clintonianus]|uniref:uncharacterized protein n=1 Tax=Suillus clintonianus TaxID=1904413 RepID=UPI001B8656E8|nr:uncharacterized protein DEU56DRAFT_759888 [Suillus clintonianus]KAG2123858.1 hypothetical protein DEU56DRAFT_759888 [Suillus clintonianus]
MYGLWYMSLCSRFNDNTRANFFRGSAYLHFIREAFFEEVRIKFYPPQAESGHQVLPICNKMTRQWFSDVLFSWAQITDWATWSKKPDIDPIIRSLYGSFPDQKTEILDDAAMKLEAKSSGNDYAPMVETDEDSWRRCLGVALELFEANLKKATAEAALPTPTPLNVPVPGSSSKRPAVCFSSGYPSPAPVEVRNKKKAKTLQPVPKDAGSKPPPTRTYGRDKGKGKATESTMPSGSGTQHTQISSRDKGKGKATESAMPSGSGTQHTQISSRDKGKGKATESAMPSGSGTQHSIHDALGHMNISPSTPGEVTLLLKNWDEVLTTYCMHGWTLAEQGAEIDEETRQGEESWKRFVSRAPTKPS